jgi:pimeloyl-ACP methyl ester carboxylesterase
MALVLLAGCGDDSTSSQPSPAAVDTAEAIALNVSISAPYSTTPVPQDTERSVPIVLDGRVFGSGDTGVILVHMRPADQTSWFPFATTLAASGEYTVLTFDFRGHGASTGEKEFDRVDVDVTAALHYMRDDLGIEKVFLVGASLGGTAALVVAAREPTAGVISISAPSSYLQIDALSVVGAISAPKLFITSVDDIPAARSEEELWAQADQPKEREIYEGDAHGTDLFASPSAGVFEALLIAFLAAH